MRLVQPRPGPEGLLMLSVGVSRHPSNRSVSAEISGARDVLCTLPADPLGDVIVYKKDSDASCRNATQSNVKVSISPGVMLVSALCL